MAQNDAPPLENEAFAAAALGRHELPELEARLGDWLAQRLAADAPVRLSSLRHPAGAGTSSETILTRAAWTEQGRPHLRDLVVRIHPDPGRFQLFREPEFETQFRVLEVLHSGRLVRVPEPLFFEGDASLLGLPFFVMSQLEGRVPVSSPPYNAEGWLFDASPAQRRVVWTTAMTELCRIATVPPSLVAFLARPELGPTGLEQQIEDWRRTIDWSTSNRPPALLWELHVWLSAHLPVERPDGLAWGDARIGNMIFDDDFRLNGVIDWEQVNFGGARQDLGWWLFFDHFHSEARGLRRLDGLGTRSETIALWEELVGEPPGDTTWYEVFAGFKVALLSIRTRLLMGDPNAYSIRTNPAILRACELTGMAVR